MSVLAGLFGVILVPLCGDAARADKRIALIIGNSSYQSVPRLPNPVNDATSIANMFRSANFDVVDARFDLGSLEFKRATPSWQAISTPRTKGSPSIG
jgi:hypothetical protein